MTNVIGGPHKVSVRSLLNPGKPMTSNNPPFPTNTPPHGPHPHGVGGGRRATAHYAQGAAGGPHRRAGEPAHRFRGRAARRSQRPGGRGERRGRARRPPPPRDPRPPPRGRIRPSTGPADRP